MSMLIGQDNDPLCICGHGPHRNRPCSECGHPEFVRTDLAIARNLAAIVKILDVVGSSWMQLHMGPPNIPDQQPAEPDPAPDGEGEAPPLPDNLAPLFPSKISDALKETGNGDPNETSSES